MTEDRNRRFDDTPSPMGTWVSIGHPTVAEVSANQDVDFVLVDTEHTTIGLETVENMVRAVEASDDPTDTIVRVPWNDHVHIKRVLDIGVDGVMVPMIDTPEEARELVAALRYPPEGNRGIASGRAAEYGNSFQEYVQNVNGSIRTIAQIETEEALDNATEIAAVDGIDALFVGPADLSGALGTFGEWESEAFTSGLRRAVDAAHDAGVPIGTLTVDVDDVPRRIEQGFDFLIVGKDTAALTSATANAREVYDRALSKVKPSSD